MARFAISMYAVLIAASYLGATSATSLDDICKTVYDPDYCIRMLQPIVSSSTNFQSLEWQKMVLNRVLVNALAAKKYTMSQMNIIDVEESTNLKSCLHLFHDSAKLINAAIEEFGSIGFNKNDVLDKLDMVSNNQGNCHDILEDGGDILNRVRELANDSITACRIAQDILNKFN